MAETISFSMQKWPQGDGDFAAPADLFAALLELSGEGFRGQVSVGPTEPDGPPVWRVEVNTDDPTVPGNARSVSARLGEVLIRMGGGPLQSMTRAQYDAARGIS